MYTVENYKTGEIYTKKETLVGAIEQLLIRIDDGVVEDGDCIKDEKTGKILYHFEKGGIFKVKENENIQLLYLCS